MTKSGMLTKLSTTGSTSAMSHPFKARPSHLTARSSDVGVVISGDPGRARYLTFDDPSAVHHLKTGAASRPYPTLVVCGALSQTYAACTTFGALSGRPTKAALIPLNGKAPLDANDHEENFGRVGLLGASTLAWTRWQRGLGAKHTLGSRTTKSATITVGKGANLSAFSGALITAYGKILVLAENRHDVLSTKHGKGFTVVATAPLG